MSHFDAVSFFRDHGIRYITAGNKHCAPGWLQVHCAFCSGSQGYHLGYKISGGYFHCWRCGGHSVLNTIKQFAYCDWREAREIASRYGMRPHVAFELEQDEIQRRKRKKKTDSVVLPTKERLGERHIKYLKSRRFNPTALSKTWGLLGTGPHGPYKWRIIAPIFFEGRVVSFQGRDITGRSELKYKACASEYEIFDHKDVLYGYDLVPDDTAVAVEGVFDVFRLGPGAVGTFGTAFKPKQVDLLSTFKKVYLLYDSEDTAQAKAESLGMQLDAVGTEAILLTLPSGDPGEMSQYDANLLMLSLGFSR